MSEWRQVPLRDLATDIKDGTHGTHARVEAGIPFLSAKNVSANGKVVWDDEDEAISETEYQFITSSFSPKSGDLLVTVVGTLGRTAIFDGAKVAFQRSVAFVRPSKAVLSEYLYHASAATEFLRQLERRSNATAQAGLYLGELAKIRIPLPPLSQQHRIAEILSTLDEAIEQTEALIAKHQQIKAGLMHDLFTRGLTPDGQLRLTREQAPDLYKESPLGCIPKEWKTKSISAIADSLADGPFGSNLKSEHYVVEPGVRVVRLQNIQESYYNDRDPAFVSQHHADYLVRNAVNPGDVLIAALGDESYPVGRACCYPAELPSAINKADCFRLRCHSEMAINTYVMNFLNTAAARHQVKRYEQGVTRRRINLGNFRRVIVALPSLDEQEGIIRRLAISDERIKMGELQVKKLLQQKHGLMHDLLTGKVPVNATPNVQEDIA